MGKPCLGGIWSYPIFTAFQGAFIVYFAITLLRNERKLNDSEQEMMP
jgi:hypothetical protein